MCTGIAVTWRFDWVRLPRRLTGMAAYWCWAVRWGLYSWYLYLPLWHYRVVLRLLAWYLVSPRDCLPRAPDEICITFCHAEVTWHHFYNIWWVKTTTGLPRFKREEYSPHLSMRCIEGHVVKEFWEKLKKTSYGDIEHCPHSFSSSWYLRLKP